MQVWDLRAAPGELALLCVLSFRKKKMIWQLLQLQCSLLPLVSESEC